IWMPSSAAGPVSATDWPSRILSGVTPCENAGCDASAATISRIFFILDSHSEKIRVLRKLRQIELFPEPALRVDVLRADPGGEPAVPALELRRIAQSERAVDQQSRAEAKPIADQQQPRLIAVHHGPLLQQRRKIHHAVEVPADVRHPLE